MAVIEAVVGRLACPLCLESLWLAPSSPRLAPAGPAAGGVVRCGRGHSFDVARQGYLNLRVGRSRRVDGDTAEMVAARERFLATGWYAPLARALVEAAAPVLAGRPDPLVVEVGAGTGYYVTAVLDSVAATPHGGTAGPDEVAATPARGPATDDEVAAAPDGSPATDDSGVGVGQDAGCVGVALDVSKYALRRAARARPRLGAVAVDVADRLPFAAASVTLLLDVFAPRNAAEMARVLRPDGTLLVVTPGPDHLAEVVGPLGTPSVDEAKAERLDATVAGRFERTSRQPLSYPVRLVPDEVVDLVAMGPAGHHVEVGQLRREVVRRWPDGVAVTASFVVSGYRPAGAVHGT